MNNRLDSFKNTSIVEKGLTYIEIVNQDCRHNKINYKIKIRTG